MQQVERVLIEDWWLTVLSSLQFCLSRIVFVYRPVWVFACSIYLTSFTYFWGLSRLRRKVIIVAQLLCSFTAILLAVLLCVQSASTTYCAHSPVRCYETFLLIIKTKLRLVKFGLGPEQPCAGVLGRWVQERDTVRFRRWMNTCE